ncbi:MAG: TlpA disulfide reductase family protein [Acidobacteriota bacterium]
MSESSSRAIRNVFFGAALSVLALSAGYLGWSMGRPVPALESGGQELPPILREFSLDSLDGDSIGPATLEGKAVVVDFWATWCKPCVVQARLLEKVYSEYAERGVDFVAVSVGEEPDIVRDYVAEKPYSYPVLVDPEGVMGRDGQIYMLPTVMVLDADRQVVFLGEGITGAPKLRAVLDRLLEPAQPRT